MRRPVVLIVLGIVNLTWAALGLLGDLRAVVALVTRPPGAMETSQGPTHAAVFAALILSGAAATLVLAVAGVGLLRARPWGRSLSIGYALYTLAATPLAIVLKYSWVAVPTLARAAAESPRLRQMVETRVTQDMAALVAAGLLGLAYAAILLWCMSRPGVRAALRRSGAAKPQPTRSAAPLRPAHGRLPFRSSV